MRYPDDRRLHLAPVDVTGELRVPLGFDWLVQDVSVGVPLQWVDGGVNWTEGKEVTHGQWCISTLTKKSFLFNVFLDVFHMLHEC